MRAECSETVRVDHHAGPGVAVVAIDRPDRANALDPLTIRALCAGLADLEHDERVHVVVLTGTGDRAFCAGMDLQAFASDPTPLDERPTLDVILRRTYGKPVVAAVNGAAVAGGFELVLACDLVVAAVHARFGLPEVRRGLVAAGGGTRLPSRLPLAIALELGLTGEPIDADRALALGLVNRVAPADAVLDEAVSLATSIAANAPLAVKVTRQLMHDHVPATGWRHVADAIAPVFASDDAREGARAFAERRRPRWTGR